MRTLFAALTVLLILTTAVFGQCNLRARTSFVTYSPIVVAKPVVSYDYHHKEVVYVPKIVEVEVQREHYYSIDSYAQQNLLADAIVGRLLRLQAEQLRGAPKMSPVERVPEAPIRTPELPKGPAGAGAYQNAELLKVINDSCVKCHGTASKYTPLITSDGKLPDLPAGKVWECFGLVNSGEMPKGGKSLDDNQVKLFYEWAKNARK